MSPEAQRIAIAEILGDRLEYLMANPPIPYAVHLKKNVEVRDFTKAVSFGEYPDLNAMHEAENTLLKVHIPIYLKRLRVATDMDYFAEVTEFLYVHATAAQRAEAFLKCIGKWTDEPANKPQSAATEGGL